MFDRVTTLQAICHLCYVQSLDGCALMVETFRSCITGLLEAEGIDRIYWLAFTYIKVCFMFQCILIQSALLMNYLLTSQFSPSMYLCFLLLVLYALCVFA